MSSGVPWRQEDARHPTISASRKDPLEGEHLDSAPGKQGLPAVHELQSTAPWQSLQIRRIKTE